MALDTSSIDTIANMIDEVELLISTTTPLPEKRTERALELLRSAKAIAEDMAANQGLEGFKAVLQTVADWRHEVVTSDPEEFAKRDKLLSQLELLATDIYGPIPIRAAPRKRR